MSETIHTEADAIASIALSGARPDVIIPGELYTVPDSDGGVRLLDTEALGYAPRRVMADRVLRDAESFIGYVNRHGTDRTEVYADSVKAQVVAVLDSHAGVDETDAYLAREGRAGWQSHTVTLKLEKTPSWLAWMAADGQLMPQSVFADFIEAQAADVREPSSATMLEIAQSFHANTKVQYESGHRNDSGQVRLEYKETIEAKAGQKGNVDIPAELGLVLRPYLGGPPYSIKARFRYRIATNGVLLGFALDRPQEVLDAAFTDVVTEIRDGRPARDGEELGMSGIAAPIFNGRP